MTTQRRRRAWSDVIVNQVVLSGNQSSPIDLLVDLPDNPVKTAVRLIGDLTAFPDDRNAATDGVMQIDLGIGVGSTEAFSAAVMPDPQVQADYPTLGWLYISSRIIIFNNSSGTTEKMHVAEFHFDIRANWKVDRGTLYAVWHNTLADATGYTVRMAGRIRSLCLT